MNFMRFSAARQAPWLLFLTLLILGGCSAEQATPPLQGYVEGEFAMIAATTTGRLDKLLVRRGQQVEPGALLFALEHSSEEASVREATERVRSAEQRLANLRTGRRPPEIEVARAQTAQATALRKLSAEQMQQQERLFKDGFISQAALDQARANFERDQARLAETQAQGSVAQLPLGRDAEISAAVADVETARAVLAQGEWRLAQRNGSYAVDTIEKANGTKAAPALVQDTFFVEGESVPAGRPVVSLLPIGNVKVRFFVPETLLGAIKAGERISIACDGCGAAIPATISYISKQAEYTPPVIYSKDSRAKLVFMIEARPAPEDAVKLRPGQPVDVTLASASTNAAAAR